MIRRTFLRFLAGYVLLLLVPLSLGTVITRRLVSEYEEKVIESRIDQLEQARDIIARYVDELEWRVYRIAGNTGLNRYLMRGDNPSGTDRLLVKGIVNDLKALLLYDSSLVSVFYIHVFGTDTILTPNSVYNASDFVDGKTFFRMDGTSTGDWLDEITSRYHTGSFYPAVPVTFEDFKNKPMVPYVRSLPLSWDGRREDVSAAIVYFIGEEEFTGLLRHITMPDGGYTYIADEYDRILSGRAPRGSVVPVHLPDGSLSGSFQRKSESGDGEAVLVTYVVSPDNGWRFVSVLPVPWVFRSVRFMQYLSYGVLLVALLLSVGISAVISWRRSETLRSLFGLIGGGEGRGGSDYRDLNAGVSRLVVSNDEMRRELQEQQQFVFRNFINRLLNGYYRDEDTLAPFRDYLGLPAGRRKYTAVALQLRGRGKDESVFVIRELESLKTSIRTEFENSFIGNLWTYESEEDLMAFVFSTSISDDREHEAAVSAALDSWIGGRPDTASHAVHLGTGETVSSLLKIHSSWVHAREAGVYSLRNGLILARFVDIQRELDSYYYPIELELRLLNAVRAGDSATLDEVFRELRRENIDNRNLPEERVRWLLDEIRSSLLKLENLYGPTDREMAATPETLEEGFTSYGRQLAGMCEEVNKRKKSHNHNLIRNIEDYIQKRYTDHNLSLSSVATEFSITESYLSYFFKEQTGENFSTRVESIRVNRAVHLLVETELSIAGIAVQVGYNSDKTFRRVFRRLKGISPNEYRQDMRLRRVL